MPALRESPLETINSNLSRPRVWAFPEVRSHGLVVLTKETLFLAGSPGTPDPAILRDLEKGVEVDSALGSAAERLDLAAMRKVKHDLEANALVLDVDHDRGGTKQVVVEFQEHPAADACFTKLWRRLGRKAQLLPWKKDFWDLARLPITVMMGILTTTLALAITADGLEHVAEARSAGVVTSPLANSLEAILGGVSWEVICGIGGVLIALTQVWLYRRVTEPPHKLEIVRA